MPIPLAAPIPFTSPHVSLNRVHIVDLPGIPMDDEVRGQRANALLSFHAVERYVQALAAPLRLPAAWREEVLDASARAQLGPFVNECLRSEAPGVAAAAQAIAARLGRNLGHLLLTLHRGDAVNQAVRPDWTADDWARWASIRQVWLGGGFMSGELGRNMIAAARDWLRSVGYGDRFGLGLSGAQSGDDANSHMPFLVLLGAARYLPFATTSAVCLDFGHSSVKRAYLQFASDETASQPLASMSLYAGQPVELERLGAPDRLLEFMVSAIAQTFVESWRAGCAPEPDVMVSVGAYGRDGQVLTSSLYQQLHAFGEDARQVLGAAVSQRLQQTVRVRLIHDGTAAAAVHAGEPHTAVIVVGTGLGIGFAPASAKELRPLASIVRARPLGGP